MAKKTYKARFADFRVEVIKAANKVENVPTISGHDEVIYITREAFNAVYEAVKDFVKVKEFEEEMKPYRNSTHRVSYAVNTNSYGGMNITFIEEEPAPAIELNESMISNHRGFNNCGEYTITIENVSYSVRYFNDGKRIETEAPEHIKKALVEWWFI